MEQGGLHVAVVTAHDAEALGEGGAVVARGHAFVEVVDEREARVMQHGALLHHADTPVEVSGEAVAEVVGHGTVAAGEESLVADEHPLAEAAPRKVFGRFEAAHPQEVALAVDDGGTPVNDIGQSGQSRKAVDDELEGVVFVQLVAGIEETHVVARGEADALVHRVVQPAVGLAHYGVDVLAVAADDFHRAVSRGSVDDDVFDVLVRLGDDALQGVFDDGGGVVGHRDDGEFGMKVCQHRRVSVVLSGDAVVDSDVFHCHHVFGVGAEHFASGFGAEALVIAFGE